MELFRRAANPWGQEEVLLGVAWDLFWAAVVVGLVFVVAHALLVRRLAKGAGETAGSASVPSGIPERVVRHNAASRIFHWSMAASMLVLLATAFVPIMGFQFDWVLIHWVAGLVLIVTVLYHVIHASFFNGLSSMWVSGRDMGEGVKDLTHLLGVGDEAAGPTGKYPVANKLFHHGATAATLVAIATGLFMMVRIDTPVFTQDQYLLEDGTWGIVYVLHGLAGVGPVLMVIAHIYFAVRPEKWWQTRSMIKGWITREEFLRHHDPERWPVGDAPAEEAEPEPVAGQHV